MSSCVGVTRKRSRPSSVTKPTLCDVYFLEWWSLRIVERYPAHEVPNAWLMMHISIRMQQKLKQL